MICLNFTDGQERRKNLAGLQGPEQGGHLPELGCQGTQKPTGEQVVSVYFSLI